MTAAVVLEMVPNPFAYCAGCDGEVHYRAGGRNLPCGCVAAAESICPSWEPFNGCQCPPEAALHLEEIAKAEALQAALEDQERDRSWYDAVGNPVGEQLDAAVLPFAAQLRETPCDVDAPSPGDDVIRQASELQIVLIIVLSTLVLLGLAFIMIGTG